MLGSPESMRSLDIGAAGALRAAGDDSGPRKVSSADFVAIGDAATYAPDCHRRIPDKRTLVREIAAWERRRNADRARIKWLFTIERARTKMGRACPERSNSPGDVAA